MLHVNEYSTTHAQCESTIKEYLMVCLPSELWQKDLELFPFLLQYISVNMAKSTGEKMFGTGNELELTHWF